MHAISYPSDFRDRVFRRTHFPTCDIAGIALRAICRHSCVIFCARHCGMRRRVWNECNIVGGCEK
eukprot:3213540-Prymnesium_polylepis.1